MLFFIGTLLPALGFFNLYPMRYSFVADHFQYLASIGLIVPASPWGFAISAPEHGCAMVLLPCMVVTFRQAMTYRDAETLWRYTEQRNPRSWMVQTNLANALIEQDRDEEASRHHERAIELEPNLPETHWNVGIGLRGSRSTVPRSSNSRCARATSTASSRPCSSRSATPFSPRANPIKPPRRFGGRSS